MAKKVKIVVAGILDTKGKEIQFIADRIKAAGGAPTILELSVGKEAGWADIHVSDVVKKIGSSTNEIFSMERAKASDIIVDGATKIVTELLEKGEMDGIISMAGSMGTSMATRIMQALPIGVPKVMLSTMTSGDVRPYVGTKDICMVYPIAEVGLNKVTRAVLNNAAGAIVGMASVPEVEKTAEKQLIGCMMFGVTTPAVLRASKYFEDKGFDVMINHAVGSGGKSMEELIADGFIVGMLDITTHEIVDFMLGGVLSAGPDRLTAAGKAGIPQVVAPGGIDVINFTTPDSVPAHYKDELDIPGRAIKVHNPTVTVVGTSLDEAYQIAKHIAGKLNKAKSPTAICVPMKGWGAYDTAGKNPDLGWAEDCPAPMWISDPERKEWSWRSQYFVKGLRESIDRSKTNLDVLIVDSHMNEPEFADLMAELLDEMLSGKWKKGSHQNLPEIVKF
ncbi:MAG: Tm-1-like ATP-binding domain-containing protein [Spirochaetota bacterium]|nr:MAG: Tm-1-like ATP-binding domain-containing protein [Spirochaetota bacterium]